MSLNSHYLSRAVGPNVEEALLTLLPPPICSRYIEKKYLYFKSVIVTVTRFFSQFLLRNSDPVLFYNGILYPNASPESAVCRFFMVCLLFRK